MSKNHRRSNWVTLVEKPTGQSTKDLPLTVGEVYELLHCDGSNVVITTNDPKITANIHRDRVRWHSDNRPLTDVIVVHNDRILVAGRRELPPIGGSMYPVSSDCHRELMEEITTFQEKPMSDKQAATVRDVLSLVFNDFAIDTLQIADALNIDKDRAYRACRLLADKNVISDGLLNGGDLGPLDNIPRNQRKGKNALPILWQSNMTYDNHELQEVLDDAVNKGVDLDKEV